MIRLFNRNMVLQVLLILVALALLWGKALLRPEPMPDDGAILYSLLRSVLAQLPLLAVIIAILLVLTEGVLLNLLLANANIVPQTSLLPTLLYIIAASACASTLTPVILTNLILIISLRYLMLHGSLLTIPTSNICNITALIGIASFISLPAVAFLLAYLLIAINYRLYGWRDWAAMLMGFMEPYILLAIILMMTGGLKAWISQTLESLSNIGIHIDSSSPLALTANALLLLIMVVALFALWIRLNEKTVIWQKNTTTVMLFTVGGIFMLLHGQTIPADTAFFAIPFALCGFHLMLPQQTSLSYGKKKKHLWFYDILLVLTLIAALIC